MIDADGRPCSRTAYSLARGIAPLRLSWLLAVVAALLYGSLIPFRIDVGSIGVSASRSLAPVCFSTAGTEDLLTNLGVYVPLGAALVWCAGAQAVAVRLLLIPMAAVLGAAVSIGAEGWQTLVPQRVASWTDVTANVLGAGLGATAATVFRGALAASRHRMAERFRADPYGLSAILVGAGLLAFELAPFDFVTSTHALHSAFLHARWDPISPRPLSPGEPPFAAVAGQLASAAWFALLAFLLVLSAREASRGRGMAIGCAIRNGAILACVVEFLQLFTVSHTFDLATLFLRIDAVMVGAWSSMILAAEAQNSRGWRRVRFIIPKPTLLLAVVVQVLLLVMAVAGSPQISCENSARVYWIPFEALWHRSTSHAAISTATMAVQFGTLALSIELLLWRRAQCTRWMAGSTIVALTALTAQTFNMLRTGGSADMTQPIVAMLAWLAVATGSHQIETIAGKHISTSDHARAPA